MGAILFLGNLWKRSIEVKKGPGADERKDEEISTPTEAQITVRAWGKANYELATITTKLALNEADLVRRQDGASGKKSATVQKPEGAQRPPFSSSDIA